VLGVGKDASKKEIKEKFYEVSGCRRRAAAAGKRELTFAHRAAALQDLPPRCALHLVNRNSGDAHCSLSVHFRVLRDPLGRQAEETLRRRLWRPSWPTTTIHPCRAREFARISLHGRRRSLEQRRERCSSAASQLRLAAPCSALWTSARQPSRSLRAEKGSKSSAINRRPLPHFRQPRCDGSVASGGSASTRSQQPLQQGCCHLWSQGRGGESVDQRLVDRAKCAGESTRAIFSVRRSQRFLGELISCFFAGHFRLFGWDGACWHAGRRRPRQEQE